MHLTNIGYHCEKTDRVVPYNMASLATVYLGRANSFIVIFLLTAVCESGSPLEIAA